MTAVKRTRGQEAERQGGVDPNETRESETRRETMRKAHFRRVSFFLFLPSRSWFEQATTHLWLRRVGHANAWAVDAVDPERVLECQVFENDGVVAHAPQAEASVT